MFASLVRARYVLVAVLAALLVSCTFNKFAYNQADTVSAWMVDDYFDLQGPQEDDFRQRFERFHAWHRKAQLPEYAQFMRAARTRMQGELSRDDVLWFVDGMRDRVRTAGRKAAPEAAALFATLTPAQIQHLQRKLDKSNRKYVDEHKLNGTVEERHEAEGEKVIKQVEKWLAPLNREQKARVMVMVRERPQIEKQRYAERLRRQKELIELLSHRSEDPQRFTQRVTDWMVGWDRNRSAEYQKQLDASWQKRADLLVAVHRMFTPDQRTAALERLNTYAADFTQLAHQAPGTKQTAAR
jgi:hypothetical protein